MKRALLFNSGLAWAAYQVGALRHLIIDREMRFDLCAGTGLGAINAAFVACQEVEALAVFWERLSWRQLARLNWRSPWRGGPLQLKPLRKFISQHITEDKLRQAGTQLLFNCLDVANGREQIFLYPGANVPLADALAAAVTLPGLTPPLEQHNSGADRPQWVDGTLVNSFILPTLLQLPVTEVWAVAATLPQLASNSPRLYPHWRAIAGRALQLNQAQDVQLGLAAAQQLVAAAAAHQHVSRLLPEQVVERIPDAATKAIVQQRLSQVYGQSMFPCLHAPTVHCLTPSQELTYPLWRFRASDLRAAQALGYADAQAFISGLRNSE